MVICQWVIFKQRRAKLFRNRRRGKMSNLQHDVFSSICDLQDGRLCLTLWLTFEWLMGMRGRRQDGSDSLNTERASIAPIAPFGQGDLQRGVIDNILRFAYNSSVGLPAGLLALSRPTVQSRSER